MRKILQITAAATLLLIALIFPIFNAAAQSGGTMNVVHLYFFNGDGCPHCADEKIFLKEMEDEYGAQLEIHSYEVWYSPENAETFETFAKAFNFEPTGVPITFIGDQYWTGFGATTREALTQAIADGVKNGVIDAQQIVNGETPAVATIDGSATGGIKLPLVGQVDLTGKSIWVSTILIGIVDGVNPCSLWVLTMLLAMIVRTANRKKTLIIGFVFLTVTSLIYALFIGGVFSVLSYVSFMQWIQAAVAVITLIMGLINFKDYFFFKEGISLTIDEKHKPGIYERIRNVMNHSDNLWAMIGATILLGIGVSLVEFSCTAAFPVVWSSLVVNANVSTVTFVILLILYMVLYQLDELVIFGIAVFTMRSNRLQEKHGQILKLFSGTLMIVLSFVMLVKPSLMNELGQTLLIFLIALLLTGLIYLMAESILPAFGIYIGHKRPSKKKKKK